MIANELRLGNWVQGKTDPPMQVAAISKGTIELYLPGSEADNFIYDDAEVNGIILTPEWMKRFGMIGLHPHPDDIFSNHDASFTVALTANHENVIMLHSRWMKDVERILHGCKYVHEIQNLYFFLIGTEINNK